MARRKQKVRVLQGPAVVVRNPVNQGARSNMTNRHRTQQPVARPCRTPSALRSPCFSTRFVSNSSKDFLHSIMCFLELSRMFCEFTKLNAKTIKNTS